MNFRIFVLYSVHVVTVTEHYPIFQVKKLDLFDIFVLLCRFTAGKLFQQNASVVVVVVVSSMAVIRIL